MTLYQLLGETTAVALSREPQEFELHARLLRALASTGDVEQTTAAGLELVRRFRASDQSMKLLREVYGQLGRGDELTGDLRRLHEAHPGDPAIRLALVDVLQEQGRTDEAEALLAEAVRATPNDTVRALHFSVDLDDTPIGTIDIFVHHFHAVSPDDAYVTMRWHRAPVVFDVSVDNADPDEVKAIEALRAERFDEFALYVLGRLGEFIEANPVPFVRVGAA